MTTRAPAVLKTGKRERLLRLGGIGGRDARFPARLAAHLRSHRLHTGACTPDQRFDLECCSKGCPQKKLLT